MSCPETPAVESLHDGRLANEPASALRRHLTTCVECAREAARLEALGEKLVALRESGVNPLRVAAGRTRLLEVARSAGEAKKSAGARPGALMLAAAAVVTLAWFGLSRAPFANRGHVASTSSRAADPELALTVEPAPGTRWSRARSDAGETLTLNEGRLAVQVIRHDAGQRLLVTLPDGELEDVGTVFTVEVHGEKTRDVAVAEGRVALRLRGKNELVLSAGESFHAPDDAAPPVSAEPQQPAEPEPSADVPAAPAGSMKHGSHAGSGGDEVPSCPGASLFQDGVEAFKRGNFAGAASLLERFSSACARSSHGEDAAYLRMVALARAGQAAAARVQARAYLERFPQGFRRKEAERLAGGE